MMHDHFGFYICWGVTTWLPAIYTSQALYLGSIYLNYAADAQRKRVRETAGTAQIWARAPG